MSALDSCTVDKDADFMTVGEDAGGQRGDLILDCEVGRVNGSFAAQLFDGFFSFGVGGVSLCIQR